MSQLSSYFEFPVTVYYEDTDAGASSTIRTISISLNVPVPSYLEAKV
ncbi:hypothetical protein JCM19239_4506 [Vibrio variabilis]|uniref:Uncharacterized protein n=1 Tax=Vibrio variabilis TaxID=990271 RepID=A0ABQ0JRM2_9VIBR|nr:hypothetical protein JCM19239_4506 [Vibrio variabilis]